jgi:VanZ family protein
LSGARGVNIYYLAAVGYLVFVVYGSLVPLDYNPFPFDQALTKFKNIPFLELGIESRADWIANILLYIPLSFLLTGTLRTYLGKGFFYSIFLSVVVAGFCIATAVFIEFIQQFFPPRTVSLNDLLAESLGTLIGIMSWFLIGEKLQNYFRLIGQGNWLSIKSAVILFLAVYVFLSLFPFDFVTSMSELDNKLASGHDSFFFDIKACQDSLLRCVVKLIVEMLVLVPLGVLFAALPIVHNRYALAIVVGFFLGIVIEFTQVFIYSGSGQGLSIPTRMMGIVIGVKAYSYFSGLSVHALSPKLRNALYVVLLPYFLLIVSINGWLDGDWISSDSAIQKLKETQFLPFYYFYYTTETEALVSLLSNIGSYTPVGFWFWLKDFVSPAYKKMPTFGVGLIAALLAIIVESGKLFLQAKHVDPTDVIIAFVASSASYFLLNQIQNLLSQPKAGFHAKSVNQYFIEASSIEVHGKDNSQATNKHILLASVLALVIIYQVFHYPLEPILLAIGLLLYCYGLYKKTLIGFFVVPALLPVLDFTPWTGRFYFDEFDLVVLCTVTLLLIRPLLPLFLFKKIKMVDSVIVSLFLLLICVSCIFGLNPLAETDANSFSNYYSKYNALRVFKGFLYALLLSPFLIKVFQDDKGRRFFSAGLLTGLAGTGFYAIFERWIFPGLFDFSADYRINALFSSMHTGGGHIESYLAMSMPFIAILFVSEKYKFAARIIGILLFILSLYTLLMTFSRGGAIGVATGFIVLLIGFGVHFKIYKNLISFRSLLLIGFLIVVTVGLSVPVFQGDLMKARFSQAEADSESRHTHWEGAIDAMDSNLLTQLFGMGLGSFPRVFYWSNLENAHPATYKIDIENGNKFLTLQGGDALFMGQYITLLPQQSFKLALDVRSPTKNATLSIPICEKSLQYSFRCVDAGFTSASSQWQHVETTVMSGDVGAYSKDVAAGLFTRPVQLALYAGSNTETIIEVDNLSLQDASGHNLIANGDFSAGMDRWFFSTEKHNPWHIFNLWVQVLFDIGWLGLASFVLLVLLVYYRLLKALRHDVYASILLASLTGFLIIGYVDSPFDAPRLAFLFSMLVVFAIFCLTNRQHSSRLIK